MRPAEPVPTSFPVEALRKRSTGPGKGVSSFAVGWALDSHSRNRGQAVLELVADAIENAVLPATNHPPRPDGPGVRESLPGDLRMSIALAEQLKKEWTDKYVVVDAGAPELKRFSGLTGTVRTINMNGRALVEFDGPVDISWYDIDPSYLKVVSEPLKKNAPEKHEKPAAAAAAPKPAAVAPSGEKKLSPLELARQQGAAAKAAAAAPKPVVAKVEAVVEEAAVAEPVVKAAPAPKAAGGSAREKPATIAGIIELARQQGAFKR